MSLQENFPQQFYISVITEKQPITHHPWLSERWQVLGIALAHEKQTIQRLPMRITKHSEQYLWQGFVLQLHRDEATSYYHNLLSDTPKMFVVCRPSSESAEPMPFLVTLSYDEASAYLEAEAEVYSVPIPPEIYRWAEQYVVEHYVPEQPKKRRRKNWVAEENDEPET
jgi:hypothetical protein